MDAASLLLEGGSEILMLVDEKSLRVLEVSPATLVLLGYEREELIGLPVGEIECALSDLFFWDEVILRRGGGAAEGAYRCADGSILQAIKTATEASVGGLFVVRANPIGNRKRLEEELTEISSRLGAALEAAADGILLIDSQGAILNMNRRFSDMWKLPGAILKINDDQKILNHIEEQINSRVVGVLPDHMQQTEGDDGSFETILLRDGRTFELTALPARARGQHVGWVHSYRDVTEQKRNEEQLRVAAIVFESQVGMMVTDANRSILKVNRAFSETSGYAADEVIGKTPKLFSSGLQGKDFYVDIWRIIDSKGNWEGELMNRRKNGEVYPAYLSISAVKNESGEIINYVATSSDITERKKAEAACAANQAKSQFLANMSHEIRTPMNGVIGMVDILRQTGLDPSQHRLVQTIQDSSQSLLNILNDILDFSKIEAGKLDVERFPTCIRDVIEGVAEHYYSIADAKSILLQAYVSPELPHWVLIDSNRLRQVLLNLMGNAVKFSKSGKSGRIELRAESFMLSNGCVGMKIIVTDDGIGMSEATLAKLFQPFTQEDESISRKYGGTGLGLSICKRLLQLMGGQITVRSTQGEGTEFAIELPMEPAETAHDLPKSPDLTGARVLFVSGNATNAGIVTSYCRAAGADVSVMADAASVSGLFHDMQSASILPVLLLDTDAGSEFTVPEGVRVVRLVRRGGGFVSADVVQVYADPICYDDLIRGVAIAAGLVSAEVAARLGERRSYPRELAPTVEEALAAGRLILLAEDNEINREVMSEQLRLLGYAAEFAEDGAVALEMWRNRRYGLLLTDWHMPQMDGIALTEKIRAEALPGEHIPIIAVTADAMRGAAERCLAHGMDGYISKPLRLGELGGMLAKWLPLPQAVESLPAAESIVCGATTEAPESVNAEPSVWVPDALHRMVGDNPAMHRRLLEKFLVNSQKQVDEIRVAVESGDSSTAGKVAHTLKSSSRTVGAMRFGDLCQVIEMAGKTGDAVELADLLQRFLSEYEAAALCIRTVIGEIIRQGEPI